MQEMVVYGVSFDMVGKHEDIKPSLEVVYDAA